MSDVCMVWGFGLIMIVGDGIVFDVWYFEVCIGDVVVDDVDCGVFEFLVGLDECCNVIVEMVQLQVDLDQVLMLMVDVYFCLYVFLYFVVCLNELNFDGIFVYFFIVVWMNVGLIFLVDVV